MHPQVSKHAYVFDRYVHRERWASYYEQLQQALRLKPTNILEVGVGDKFFGNFIKANTAIPYTSIDIAVDLAPDIVGSVDAMPIADGAFDLVCAFEILEHLPFERFEASVAEIARVAKRHALISVPHFGPPVRFSCKIPFLPEIQFAWKLPYPRAHVFNGQHYWEIGKRGYPVRRIKGILKKYFVVDRDFVPFESQYHHFFVLSKRNQSHA